MDDGYMNKYLMPLVLAILACAPVHARSNALEKEMEDYARDIVRAHPEVAGNLKTREARAAIYKKAKDAKILELLKIDEKKLRKKDSTVKESDYQEALNLIKSVKSKEPAITFLIKYAENPKIKADEKLLAYRLIKHEQPKLTAQINHLRKERVASALIKYTEYKENNEGKAPTTMEALELTDKEQYTHPITGEASDWIYIAHSKIRINVDGSYIVFAEPTGYGDLRVCGLDSGNTVMMKEESIKKSLEKTQAAIAKYKTQKEKFPAKKHPNPKKSLTHSLV